jgi:hypothetical protein
MNKQISVERTWQFVQYEPLRVLDTITDIPDVIASNPEAIKLLRYLQLVDIEWTYLRYTSLRLSEPKLVNTESVKEAMQFIEEERTITFENLLKAISDKPGKEETKSE